jgi:hypothetical protein
MSVAERGAACTGSVPTLLKAPTASDVFMNSRRVTGLTVFSYAEIVNLRQAALLSIMGDGTTATDTLIHPIYPQAD